MTNPHADSHPSYLDLTREVATAVLAWGGGVRVLPATLRNELRRVLPRVLVDPEEHEAYMNALRDTRKGLPYDEPPGYLSNPAELPTAALMASGIAVLRDDELAVLALDQIDLNTLPELIEGMLDSGELGKAWIDEMVRVGDEAYPDIAQAKTLAPPLEHSDDTEAKQRTHPRRPSYRTYLPWTLTAASLFLALWVWWAGRGQNGALPKGELPAVAVLKRQGALGAGDVFSLSVLSPENGFVTVVLLPPGGPPFPVYPGYGADDVFVPKGEAAPVRDLSARPGTQILAFVTPTPAAETVRKAVDKFPRGQELSADAVTRSITDALLAARFAWVAKPPVTTVP